ncbi:MAG: 16S rRNA (adenine(1518)-N(6)/adenine(1519)-N(6))-dimethyltransferase RsmA [Clostridia bacterium]|nr:16S rRNA (adenine(1518)-N(6)/adenine(1519)-N(6))-dimethyltransferase RsmA [Clostridia bacterium]
MEFISPDLIKRIAQKYGFTFKKGLGQNFLTSQEVLEKIADAAEIDGGGVLEIGPGFGVLTNELAKRAGKVVACEIDDRLIPILDDTLSEYDNVRVINRDILKTDISAIIDEEFDGEKISIAANLPYYITTPIITRVIEARLPIRNFVVMVQKEVADRIAAQPGTKDYGALSVLCQYYAVPELVRIVPAGLFVPRPKVDSAVLAMRFRKKPAVEVRDERMFFRVVKAAFSQRRKTLLNCLAASFCSGKEQLSAVLDDAGIDPRRRGETLSLAEFARIAELLT